MAVSYKVIRFQKNNSGTDGVTQDVDAGFVPKACIVITTSTNTSASSVAHFQMSIGYSDGTNNVCVAGLSRDALNTVLNSNYYREDACILRMDESSALTVLDRGSISFPSGNTVRFTWTENGTVSSWVTLIVIGGSDILNVKVGSATLNSTTVGATQDITGLGFTPVTGNAILFQLNGNRGSSDASPSGGMKPSMGVAVSTSKRWAKAVASADNVGTTTCWAYSTNARFMPMLLSASGAVQTDIDFDGWITDGFRLAYDDPPASADRRFGYMVINGGTWDCGNDTTQTSNTTKNHSVSVGGNTLRGLFTMTPNKALGWQAASTTGVDDATLSFGCSDGTTHSYDSALDEHAAATSDSYRQNGSNRCLFHMADNGATLFAASFSSFGTNQFTLTYTTTTGAADPFAWFVVADSPTQQDITKNIGDTYSVSDAITRLVSYPRGIADTYNVTDSITRLVNKPRAIGDTYSVSDAIARLVNNTRAIADTFNITDAVTRALSNTRLIIDTINISDAITRLATRTRNVADTINISDAIARLVNNTRTIGDTYNVTDSIAKLTNHPRNIGDTYSISDSITVNVQRTRAVNDSYNVSDSITRTQTLVRAIADSFNITDAITRAQTLTRLLIESYSISDAVARALTLLRSISDTYNVTDAINRLVSFQRLLADTYNITDNLTRSQILTRGIGDTYNITDSVARVKTAIRNIGDTYSISDLVDRTLELTRIIEDTININDSVSRIQSIFRDVADNYNITDSITRAQNLTRNIEDDIDINDSIDRVLELTRDIEDTFDITDNVNNAASITVDVADTINVNDSVTRSQILSRTINDSYNVTDLVTRLVRFTRLVEDTYNVNDALIRQILVTKSLSDTYDITDEVETQIDEPANVINVDLEDSYNISDNITREQILQRIITESYNITDSIQKEGGQEPIVVDEHLQIKGGTGVGLGTQESLDKQKRRIIKRVVMDLLPESFPDKIYIDNQKAWFLNDKLDTNQKVREIRFTNKVSVPLLNKNGAEVAPFAIKNGITTIKQVKEKEQIRIAIKQMETNDYALKQFIQNTIPRKIKFENLDGIRITNNIYSNIIDSTISIQNAVTIKHTPINTIINHVLVNMQESAKPIVIKSPILLNTNYNFNIKNKIEIKNNNNNKIIRENRVTSLVKDNKKYSIKEIKNILLNKSSVAYDKILSNILKKNYSNTDEKEKLHFYLSYYQTRFDIEKTKTNHDMDKLDKKYGDKLEMLYAQIAEEYRNDLPNLWKAKDKYGKEIYDDIRSITQKGYNIGIDYVSRATERDDIYVTQKDLDNVKEATEEAYNHYWDSIQKNIKTKQIRLAYEEVKRLQEQAQEEVELQQQNQNFPIILPKDTIVEKPKEFLIKQEEDGLKPRVEITPEEATALFLKSLTTKIVALATYDKLLQMQDIFNQQNIQLQFIFATERDAAVCPDCLRFDYRFTQTVYTQYNYQLLPKPPIHFNCRCRILLKIGNRVIVK